MKFYHIFLHFCLFLGLLNILHLLIFQVILLAKTIDGVYSADPKKDSTAKKYDKISYLDILNKDLKVMDSTATSLCRDNNIPLVVFGIDEPENMVKIIEGENIGTIVE